MNDKLKNALDHIHAEDELKTNTLAFLRMEIQKREKPRSSFAFRRVGVALASVAAIFFASNIYFTPAAFVDVDVNPSIEIVLNRFDRVIDTYAYNTDGEAILENTDVKHKDYDDAIGVLIDSMVENGYAEEAGLVSVTVQSDGGADESIMLSNIETTVREHHSTAQIEAFPVDGIVRDTARELNLSPAKYLAIQDLIEIDPTSTVDSCRDHSIGEIRQLTETHASYHHGGNIPDDSVTPDDQSDPYTNSGEHEENRGHGGRHR